MEGLLLYKVIFFFFFFLVYNTLLLWPSLSLILVPSLYDSYYKYKMVLDKSKLKLI